jgi:hypothetical protein
MAKKESNYSIRHKPYAEAQADFNKLATALRIATRVNDNKTAEVFGTITLGNGELILGFKNNLTRTKRPCYVYIDFVVPTQSYLIDKAIAYANTVLQHVADVNVFYTDDDGGEELNYNAGDFEIVNGFDEGGTRGKLRVFTKAMVNASPLQWLEEKLLESQGKINSQRPPKGFDYNEYYAYL